MRKIVPLLMTCTLLGLPACSAVVDGAADAVVTGVKAAQRVCRAALAEEAPPAPARQP
ncbi:MAG: hypothetical protein H6806_04730 [Planctomycetes bacterium]|nr:hypothetical protein [Planctomycetota bacterium]